MKENCLTTLSELIRLSLTLCGQKPNNVSSSDTILRTSEKLCRECINAAEKAFILPIDREDVACISLKVHRLNQKLYALRRLTAEGRNGNSERITDTRRYVESLCRTALRYSENGFKKLDILSFPLNISVNEAELHRGYDERYNPYALFADTEISQNTEDCRKAAEDLSDYIIRTVVKNS